ncbi:polysaccharide biosynthesis/export family protein [Blastomonas sp. RAC04]|uniref:polysaccharide biosynthesis/export family protein n=1 Tax=Blastomonas sp. RAC04 TaxID=1842535 RepID=UPI00085745C8|nr:polysaccharide biosynthesis/export family protein [Blastomonas sp. RAC04]AOG02062.1 polysaccharide biosynthesis/export family protein [Blastomonas sp. RAC04]
MKNVREFCFLAAAICLALSGCASSSSGPIGGGTNLSLVGGEELPTPLDQDYLASEQPFVIGPFDVLTIAVYGDDLGVEGVQVDASGRISFPLIGSVEVAGKSPQQVGSEIEDRLKQGYYKNPKVSVNMKETSSQVVSIGGEVKRPGIYPVIGDMTLMKAIARAEGWTEFSKKREVIIFRNVSGKKYAALYDARAIERGNYMDPRVYPNDTIIIGDSQARRDLKNIYGIAPSLIAPLIFLLDSNN